MIYLDTSVVAALHNLCLVTADAALAGSADVLGVEVQLLRSPTEA